MKHAELPWEDVLDGEIIYIDDKVGNSVCDLYHISASGRTFTKENAKANAVFIVKAVNNHYRLLEALKRFKNPHQTVHGALVISWDDVDAVKEAIKQAEEV